MAGTAIVRRTLYIKSLWGEAGNLVMSLTDKEKTFCEEIEIQVDDADDLGHLIETCEMCLESFQDEDED